MALLLGIAVAGGDTASAFDDAVASAVAAWLGDRPAVLGVLTLPTHPVAVLGLLGLAVVVCIVRRDRYGCALLLAAPTLVIGANTWLLKPLFDRQYGDHLAYPSGHTVSLVAALTAVALLVPGRWSTCIIAGAAAVLTTAAGIGMIGLDYHYATDIIGGAAFAIAGVLVAAATIERIRRRFLPAPGR